MFGTPTIPIGTPTIGMATTIKVAELPNLSIIPCCVKRLGAVHGKPWDANWSNGLEQFMENPEMPTDQGLFLAFIGLELTQNGLNMSAWCWRRMENGQSRQGMSGGYLSVVWHLFESTTRDKQWTLETTAATRTRRAFFLTRFSNSKLSRFLQPSALSQEVGTICHSLEVSAL